MKELDEVYDDLMWKAKQCIDEGVCWVRADDFEEVANKIEKINATLSKAPANTQQQLQPDNSCEHSFSPVYQCVHCGKIGDSIA